MKHEEYALQRLAMVTGQLSARGIADGRVLEVFRQVPRHLFVPSELRHHAYEDRPLPIGHDQTISQPYIVALMTEALAVTVNEKVLEVGTGSGYQAAILASLGCRVFSIERIAVLAESARVLLASLGLRVSVAVGDGTLGESAQAPYDKIIVTAAAPRICESWKEQLAVGGRLVVPLGGSFAQDLIVVDKVSSTQLNQRRLCGCVFVPLVGKYGFTNTDD